MVKHRWFIGQVVFYRRGEVGGVWWGDSGVIRKIDGPHLYVAMEWGITHLLGDGDTFPLKYVLERNARVLRVRAAAYMRQARALPKRTSPSEMAAGPTPVSTEAGDLRKRSTT